MTEIFNDINKMYRFSRPTELLAPFIEFFSESCGAQTTSVFDGKPFSVKLFPSWTPTIWINLGKPYGLQMNGRTTLLQKDEDILILRDGTVTRQIHPADHIFTIKFFPGGLQAIMGIEQPVLRNKICSAAAFLPAKLIACIKNQYDFTDRKSLVETFFLQQLQQQPPRDHYTKLVRDSIGLYAEDNMHYNISQVAEKMFVTSKTINRYFHRVVGTAPKQYFALLKTRKALSFYAADKINFDPTRHGYYDHSHFYKAVQDFTGDRLTARQ